MTEHGDILREIERDERRLARWLADTPSPSEETVRRTRDAVSYELASTVLSEYETPAPDRTTIHATRRAVSEELGRIGPRRPSQADTGRTYRIFGAMAAAASIVFAIGLVRFVVPGWSADPVSSSTIAPTVAQRDDSSRTRSSASASLEDEVADLAEAFQAVAETRDPALTVLADDIDRASVVATDALDDPMDAELRSLGTQIESALTEWDLSLET